MFARPRENKARGCKTPKYYRFNNHRCPFTGLVKIPTQRGARLCVYTACLRAPARKHGTKRCNDLANLRDSILQTSKDLSGCVCVCNISYLIETPLFPVDSLAHEILKT